MGSSSTGTTAAYVGVNPSNPTTAFFDPNKSVSVSSQTQAQKQASQPQPVSSVPVYKSVPGGVVDSKGTFYKSGSSLPGSPISVNPNQHGDGGVYTPTQYSSPSSPSKGVTSPSGQVIPKGGIVPGTPISGGGNVNVSYTFQTFNDFTVIHSGEQALTAGLACTGFWNGRTTTLIN